MSMTGRRTLRLTKTCEIRRVAPGSSDRIVVAANVGCSSLYPASLDDVERADMATATKSLSLYVLPLASNAEIEIDWRVGMGGKEYRIRAVSPWPWDDPVFWHLLVEDEQ